MNAGNDVVDWYTSAVDYQGLQAQFHKMDLVAREETARAVAEAGRSVKARRCRLTPVDPGLTEPVSALEAVYDMKRFQTFLSVSTCAAT